MTYADQIAIGTAVLTRRILGGTWQTVAIRGGAGALASPYLLAELRPYPLAVPVGVAAWLGAAWWYGRPAEPTAAPEPAAEDASERPEPAPGAPAGNPIPAAVRRLAGDGAGAHYTALAQYLTKTTGRRWDTAAVKAARAAAGIPHAPSVRQPGRGVSTGVRVEDLPDPSPSPAPVVAVVVAGQDTTTDPATATTTGPRLRAPVEGGGAMAIVDDPAATRRYTVTKETRHG